MYIMLQIPNEFGQAIAREINLYHFIESWLKHEYTSAKLGIHFINLHNFLCFHFIIIIIYYTYIFSLKLKRYLAVNFIHFFLCEL